MPEIVSGAQINETHANVKRSRSRFPLKQLVLDTHRFGEYHPHLCIDGITSDKIGVRSAHSSRSYTLKAPLMQNIYQNMDYFLVPLRAILPEQAERIVTNPTIGDDVPSDAYTNVEKFVSKILSIHTAFGTLINYYLSNNNLQQADEYTLRMLVFMESIFSNGSLLASLGCNLGEVLRYIDASNNKLTFDQVFDNVIYFLETRINALGELDVQIDGTYFSIVPATSSRSPFYSPISIREFIARLRDTSDWQLLGTISADIANAMYTKAYAVNTMYSSRGTGSDPDIDLDLARPFAYQLSCAEFFTNDKVDYVYSAELYRQYLFSLVDLFFTVTQRYFVYNGLRLRYDFLSSHFFNAVCTKLISYFTNRDDSNIRLALQYFISIFGYKRSLRYKDYFTGSRTAPLAVGNTNVPVSGSNVSVIDISRGIQAQRFLNAVNATGRKFGEYLKGIFGDAPTPDHHNPLFLAHVTDSIFTSEVENTGSDQLSRRNSVTAVFRGNGNQFVYEVEVSEPSIILGVTSYDIQRAYPYGIERSFFTKDRFDMFLPELQYVGDQKVFADELDCSIPNRVNANTFGYQFRDMQYKQLVNRACGGFSAKRLPGYAFMYESVEKFGYETISPDFIRSRCAELDQFYLSLVGYSLGTYWHFITIVENSLDASRPMSVNPQILG